MNKARQSILSLMLALLLTTASVSTLATTAYADDLQAPQTEVVGVSVVASQENLLPNLDNLEPALEFVPDIARRSSSARINSRSGRASKDDPLRVNGLLNPVDFSEEDMMTGRRNTLRSDLITNPNSTQIGNTMEITNWDPDDEKNGIPPTKMQVVLAAVGSKCAVYVHTDTTYSPESSEFLPTGSTAAVNAQQVADKFDSKISPLLTSNAAFGYKLSPYFLSGSSGRVNIVLYDIDEDGENTDGLYSGGYFHGHDYLDLSQWSNHDAIIYLDIGTTGGYKAFVDNPDAFYGTVAHEYQHLINFSQWRKRYDTDKSSILIAPHDPEGDPQYGTTLWLNEGLSGLAGVFYSNTMPSSHLNSFLKQGFAPSVGYVPTGFEWRNSGETDYVLANYGAASMLLQEYRAYTSELTPMLTDHRYGYIYGNEKVGDRFWEAIPGSPAGYGFSEFFTLANLNMALSNDDSHKSAITAAGKDFYKAANFSDIWQRRDELATGNAYGGVVDISPNNTVPVGRNFSNREYYSQLYLADALGATNGAVDITVPDSSASYYIITAFDQMSVTTNAKWNSVGKITARLNSGLNRVQVGTDNKFAVLVVTHNETIPSNDNFSYSLVGAKAPSVNTTSMVLGVSKTGDFTVDLGVKEDGMTQIAAKATIVSAKPEIVGVVTAEVTTTGNVQVIANAVGSTTLAVTFYDAADQVINTPITINVIVTSGGAPWVSNPAPNKGGGGSSGGGGGGGSSGSGGGGNTWKPSTTVPNFGGGAATTSTAGVATVTTAQATTAAQNAATAAKTAGSATAIVNMKNVGSIALDSLKAMVTAANMTVKFQADSLTADGKAVAVRITLNPAFATQNLSLATSLTSAQAVNTKTYFQNLFNNQIAVISCAQQGGWGQVVEVAAKLDLTGMDVKNLIIYTYDSATKQHKIIDKATYWIDSVGYLHINTTQAGDIVVSNGALVKK